MATWRQGGCGGGGGGGAGEEEVEAGRPSSSLSPPLSHPLADDAAAIVARLRNLAAAAPLTAALGPW